MRSFKSLSLAALSAVALTASATLANAADVNDGGVIQSEPIYSSPLIGWTGFYAGGNIGGAFDETEDVEFFDADELVGGFHLGYNWQLSSNIVISLEGDVNFLDDVEYLSSIRGRLGYSFGPALAYATGGAAFIGFDDEIFGDESETGYVVGGGMEYKVRDNWSVGGEALFYGFDDPDGLGADPEFWTLQARLTYHVGSVYEALK